MGYSWERELPRTASTMHRAGAFAIDAVIVFALAWTFSFFAATAGFLRIPDVEAWGQRSPAAGLLWVVSVFELTILLVYTTVFEARGGRTPGKILTGLRVVRIDGKKLGLGDSFLRNLLRLLWVTPLSPAFIFLDAWTLRVTELDQRLGDLAAGTIVVSTR